MRRTADLFKLLLKLLHGMCVCYIAAIIGIISDASGVLLLAANYRYLSYRITRIHALFSQWTETELASKRKI